MTTQGSQPRPEPHAHPHAVRILHTSDVHLGAYTSEPHKDGELEPSLQAFSHVMELGREQGAELVLIAGDFFDHNRIKRPFVEATAEVLGASGLPVVILPGNHDPFMPEGIYAQHGDAFPSNVHILSDAEGELVLLDDVGVQVWGQAHVDFYDFRPAAVCPAWRHTPERHYWRVAMAHGYVVEAGAQSRYSYQIHHDDIAGLDAHYVALGHIDVHQDVGPDGTDAYYAGAPRLSRGATLVDLTPEGVRVEHMRHAGADDPEPSPVRSPMAPGP